MTYADFLARKAQLTDAGGFAPTVVYSSNDRDVSNARNYAEFRPWEVLIEFPEQPEIEPAQDDLFGGAA